jgi:homopolymeric O-antigen transport system permease protein
LFYLVLRDIRVVMASTTLGIFWILFQPLAMAVIMTVVLGMLIKVPTGGIPYSVIVLSGFVPWMYFSNTISRATVSMSANSYLLTKVYFPRLIIPAVPVFAGLVDMGVLFVATIVITLVFGIAPTAQWLFLPVPLLLVIALTAGAGLWLSALNVEHRDVGSLTPIVLQILAYASPVFYPHDLVPEKWRWLYDLNPMAGIVEGMRWSLLSGNAFPAYSLGVSLTAAVVLVSTGVFFFRSIEDTAADVV